MERVVVYPGKLPIVYDGNSLWEGEPPEQDSEQRKKAEHRESRIAFVGPLRIHWGMM